MKKAWLIKFLFLFCAFFAADLTVRAQAEKMPSVKSQEVSEEDGIPVLIKHLPDWENVRNSAVLTQNVEDLRQKLGERPVFDLIDLIGGSEAVAADYPQGKLLIIEYSTPQASVEMDVKTQQRLAEIGQTQQIFYRRIGNYNAFVFDAADETSANFLLDQIKYEKDVRWLGENPFAAHRAERDFIEKTSDLFVSTVSAILVGVGFAVVGGLIVGMGFFYVREQRRSTMDAFSDAGGITRLNLDELTANVSPDRLLKD